MSEHKSPEEQLEDVKKSKADIQKMMAKNKAKKAAAKQAAESDKASSAAEDLTVAEAEEAAPERPSAQEFREDVDAALAKLEKEDTSSKEADALLNLRDENQREEERTINEQFNLEYAWGMRCRRCNGVGVFFTRDPRGALIKDSEWYTRYRKQTEPYHDPKILCQCCLRRRGIRVPMLVTRSRFEAAGWRINSAHCRYVCAIHRKTGDMLIATRENAKLKEPDKAPNKGYAGATHA